MRRLYVWFPDAVVSAFSFVLTTLGYVRAGARCLSQVPYFGSHVPPERPEPPVEELPAQTEEKGEVGDLEVETMGGTCGSVTCMLWQQVGVAR